MLGQSGGAAMSDSEKLNLDSIIGRLLEGWPGRRGRWAPAAPWSPARPGSGARVDLPLPGPALTGRGRAARSRGHIVLPPHPSRGALGGLGLLPLPEQNRGWRGGGRARIGLGSWLREKPEKPSPPGRGPVLRFWMASAHSSPLASALRAVGGPRRLSSNSCPWARRGREAQEPLPRSAFGATSDIHPLLA